MKAIIQRVREAKVDIDGKTVGAIGPGLLIFLGVGKDSLEPQIAKLAEKIINLRIFADGQGRFNLSATDLQAPLLVVSQFTLYADCSRGRRPDFFNAAPPETAERFYQLFIDYLKQKDFFVQAGQFGAMMQIYLINDGPVTISLDSAL
jgi:D-aminoacyl-tRNA deacylase